MRAAAASALLAALGLLCACSGQKKEAAGEPVQTMHDLSLSRSDQGRPDWDLFSTTAHLFETQQKAFLDLPKMSFYQEGKVATNVTAENGLVHTDTQDVTFSTNVVVHSLDDGSTLYTSVLNYSSSRKKFFTDAPVVVVRRDGTVHGVGMEANGDMSEIRIFHQRAETERAAPL